MVGPASLPLRLLIALIRRLPAGRYWAAYALQGLLPPRFVTRMPGELGGLAFVCEPNDLVSRTAFAGYWEPAQTLLVRELLQPGMTFVDVGAQWGYFTLLAAARVGPRGRVLSLEPHPRLFGLLRDNLDRNGLGWVTPVPVAAGAGTSRQVLVGYDEAFGNFGGAWLRTGPPLPAARGDGRVEDVVEVRALDDLVAEQGLGAIDLLKMDIEGAEGVAIRGMKGLLAQGRVRRLVVEVHGDCLARCGGSLEALYGDLQSAGYRGLSVDEGLPTARAIAYNRFHDARRLLKPLDTHAPLSGYPHQLWLAPGVSV